MDNWKPINGRISLLPSAASGEIAKSALDLYQKVWNGKPDNYNSGQHGYGPAIAQGCFGGMNIICTTQSDRVDFVLNPASGAPPALSVIHDIDEFRASLLRIGSVIGDGAVPSQIVRIACATRYVVPKETIKECNQALIAVVPDADRPMLSDEEDVVIRVNRPFQSRVRPDVRLNRVVTWSTEQLVVLDGLAALPGISNLTTPATTTHLTASVQFEVNNTDGAIAFFAADTSALINEFFDEIVVYQEMIGLDINCH
jgi:hypothetical protein